MKIIQILPAFHLAGAESMCESLTYALKRLGHSVIVVSLYDCHTAITERLEDAGIDIRYLNKSSGFDFSLFKKLYRLLKNEKPDVVHTHLYTIKYLLPVSLLLKIKCKIHTVHSIAQKEANIFDKIINFIAYKFCSYYPVGISPIVHKTIKQVYKVKDAGLVYNGSDISKAKPKSNVEFSDLINIIHVGRFMQVKNHDGIIRAFSKLSEKYSNLHLDFYGQGELEEDSRILASELGLDDKITFHGVTDDVYSALTKSDIFILCSHYEGMPITIIEAMATGLPIVATAVGGVVDMVEDGVSGLLCMDDIDDIAEKISHMIEDKDLRQSCSQNARVKAYEFSSDNMAKGYIDIYNKFFLK